MCGNGRRRRRNAHQSKGVLLAMAIQMGREMYQKHQAARGVASTSNTLPAGTKTLPTEQPTNTAFLNDEKADIPPPPSYNEVIVNRAIVPEKQIAVDKKEKAVPSTNDANGEYSMEEYFQFLDMREQQQQREDYGVANGMRYTQVPYGSANGWEAPPAKMNCCERKRLRKAEKAARKTAEKEATRR